MHDKNFWDQNCTLPIVGGPKLQLSRDKKKRERISVYSFSGEKV